MSAAFTLPASMRIFERGWLSANNILFTGRDDTALIDTGYLTHAPQTLALVRHALGERRLDRVINTHLHSDHCGGNAALQAHYGCSTAIPAAEAEAVRGWDEDALSYKATGQQCARFSFDATVAPGDQLLLGGQHWQALAAPGHDPRSLIFYCAAEGILISADALWENGFGVIFPELDGESGFAEARATLVLIAGLDLRLVIPGHGAPFADAKAALARAGTRLDYLEADPKRNAENAVKVMLKFLLLERQQIALADVPAMFDAIPILAGARRRFLHKEPSELADWAIAALVRAGAARIDGAMLVNRD
ncbi:MBL fold metallo-hydrolase [Massilia eurypsychrophila]|uniref:beta-lactamase n=1 Tax=Massilia eurypsychrophila TaxID=1485217 RepID=A0A2G8TLN4_9BURK|nr:MBL fold metallo-hydrolase [Massilia eurypsychrophila]PIL46899.1 MBL fold metallo-hydrolase [Massilia eurypsychrophila]